MDLISVKSRRTLCCKDTNKSHVFSFRTSTSRADSFYHACKINDVKTVRQLIFRLVNEELDAVIDLQGNTSLHIAVHNGYTDIVQLLLRRRSSRTILNHVGRTAEQEASNKTIQNLFSAYFRPPPELTTEGSHFVAEAAEVETWLDSYEYAYRISAQNQEYLKRWLIKVPFIKLIEQLEEVYIPKLTDVPPTFIQTLKEYMQMAKEYENPIPLVKAYTEQQYFSARLNADLAILGSDFRFQSPHGVGGVSSYSDHEIPQNVGQYIYAAILINHHLLEQYRQAGETFRGMNITQKDIKSYVVGSIVLTRSFLSTSKTREVAEMYLKFTDSAVRPPVLCIYTVKNTRSSLNITTMSKFVDEEEVLIVPFTAFEVVAVHENVKAIFHDEQQLCVIELAECGPKSEWLI
ncbi:unnamed protein product [Rotaria socialis]|uniref:NAD(P)(+)--arginine ADP-ribosyltransferase n=1 Tax=Rotaria socialis TaxID=392032 RepID=A0A821S448_9BILA|nr:unnamed protein product [Rotaria socialis]CAF4851843.1 unnamed protein product [Rotaria socialis]